MKRKSFASKLINYLGLNKRVNNSMVKVDTPKYPFMGSPYAFKLSQVSPDNNIEMILGAFIEAPQHQIVICGNWDKSEYGRSLRQAYAIFPNIHLVDQPQDEAELNYLRNNAFAYIHGNHPEGIDGPVLSAMQMGLPLIAIGTDFNRFATNNEALYFTSTNELACIMNNTTVGRFRIIGKAMHKCAQLHNTWHPANAGFQQLFKGLAIKTTWLRKDSFAPKVSAKGLQFDIGY